MSGQIEYLSASVNLLRAILWQYNDAENLQGILQAKHDWYDLNHSGFWERWYYYVFDLRTANAFGLNVWAIILGLPLNVTFEPSTGEEVFGFSANNLGFDDGSFGIPDTGTVVPLSVEQARIALRLRFYQLFCRPCAWQTNAFLADLFKDYGSVYAGDTQNMTVGYVFMFEPPASLKFVIEQMDLLPRPAACGISITYNPLEWYGFSGNNLGLNEGTFGG